MTITWEVHSVFWETVQRGSLVFKNSYKQLTNLLQQFRCAYQRILEGFVLEATLKIIQFEPPCCGQGHLLPDQVALPNLALNTARDGASTTSLGNVCQCLITFTVNNFLLISNLNQLFFIIFFIIIIRLKPFQFKASKADLPLKKEQDCRCSLKILKTDCFPQKSKVWSTKKH